MSRPGTTSARNATARPIGMIGRIGPPALVAGLALAVLVVAVRWGTYTAGGSDSYGYVSEAHLWSRGQAVVAQPWADQVPWPNAGPSFSPLGYRPKHDDAAIVPTYPAGLPLLMAAARLSAGDCAEYWVVPVLAAVLVLATYGLGRRMGSDGAGVIAAWLVATSPVLLAMAVQPLSDVPAAAIWAVAFFLLLGPGAWSALGAGLAGGLATLVRPNLAPMAGLLVLWYVYRAWRDQATGRRLALRQTATVLLGLVPGAVALAAINHALYGSPLSSGYGSASSYYSWSHVAPNIKNYALWFADVQTPLALLGIAALLVPSRRLWPNLEHRSYLAIAALFVLGVWAQYCLFVDFDAWWYLRFLLPCWPFIMIGLGSALALVARTGRLPVTLTVTAVVVALGARGVWIAADRDSFNLWKGERRYSSAAKLARSATEDNSVVLAMQHSGSLRHYGGRVTLRYDYLEASRLDEDIAWLADRGVHPYALLDDWEVAIFRDRFTGTQSVALLEAAPLAVYRGAGTVYLYDLLPPAGATRDTQELVETLEPMHCAAAEALPQLVLGAGS